jgi:hypothetical protein
VNALLEAPVTRCPDCKSLVLYADLEDHLNHHRQLADKLAAAQGEDQ